MSDKPPRDEGSSNERSEYRLGSVTVTPAGPNDPAAYKYSDLERPSSTTPLTAAIHAVHWPIYLLFIFPLHWFFRLFRWSFRLRRLSPTGRASVYLSDAVDNARKTKFLANYDRLVLYLRASRVFTPAQVIPFLPGTAPNSDSRRGTDRPLPRNWEEVRQSVYRRDSYHCVHCGAAGGPPGNVELHVDHVVPRSRDGVDETYNLRTLCRSCHEARHARVFN